MGQRIIPVLVVGAVVLAVITARVLNIPFRKDGTSLLLVIAFLLPAIFLAQLIAVLLRKKKIRDWFATEGTIQSCDADSFYRGIQSYRCSYVYAPTTRVRAARSLSPNQRPNRTTDCMKSVRN
jgi:hypothetical protein